VLLPSAQLPQVLIFRASLRILSLPTVLLELC
jgi:hypothetical protein